MPDVVHLLSLEQVATFAARGPVKEAARLLVAGRLLGGPPLSVLRQQLGPLGRARYSGSPQRIYVDLEPGVAEPALCALDIIARNDADGLERAILSVLPFADEIVVGVDDRSDDATREVALAYADTFYTFGAAELGLAEEQWRADGIDFARARNLGRERTRAPWTFVIDTDEYVADGGERVRGRLLATPEDVGAVTVWLTEQKARHANFQRLARTRFRWESAVHNRLVVHGRIDPSAVATIVHDTSLRETAEIERRNRQRDDHIKLLEGEAAAGEITALFHLAAHKLGQGDEDGVQLAEDYRLRLEIGGFCADQRAHLAMGAAVLYYNRDDLDRADLWATRALLDGARPEAMCLKGDICEDRSDLEGALAWYNAACVTPDRGAFQWGHLTSRKHGRRESVRRAIGLRAAAYSAKARDGGLALKPDVSTNSQADEPL